MIIHALPVAGGILALAPLPGREGDFAADMAHITEWRPALVISLVTDVELAGAGAGGIGRHVLEHGGRWEHLPILDFGAPGAEVQGRWPEVSGFARRALLGGGRVLVHCRGGCGRSGMIALRLMIESGEAPDEALARLRSVRPCAVETQGQMAWAMAARREAAVFLRHEE
ncbi:protein phosphatase [Salipiger sp. P9]|uniref:protein-tyrosine phosphatase family protein n=1 Tax=Salipiger pentaromativorans TaxID=2943193 RepID=UPI002158959C|nr:protein-tyrosine phosphatase family protein [Salipiger pentaromativorans]MCR8546750.1 protein phosphatase [Salipiger pentaromativorans]